MIRRAGAEIGRTLALCAVCGPLLLVGVAAVKVVEALLKLTL